ncbi:indolepyruvate ferredoxin oxidoreductase subunit alpha [Candidatus Fermentibacteria bacterium]|nr:indolepyruvate ferredoxin oxidoreductase subunit alpha [Candidatus Fermentibacteria bacterium]
MGKTSLLDLEPGRAFLMCNEVIARAAVHAGVGIYAGYPGSPTVEILESMLEMASGAGFSAEISTNEKVALETAAGAAMAGVRAMVSMKSVGLNVASDTFFSLGYTGVEAGLVLVVADDPHAHSSQSEQDGRPYAPAALVPMLEPSGPADAWDVVLAAFETSERFRVPVIVRTVTRVNHQSGVVEVRRVVPGRRAKVHWPHGPARFVTVGASARAFHKAALERTEEVRRSFEASPLNTVERRGSRVGVIASASCGGHAREALRITGGEASLLTLATAWPMPENLVAEFLSGLDRVVVVEELSPFLEDMVIRVAGRENLSVEIAGKHSGHFSPALEYNADIVADALARVLRIPAPVEPARAAETAAVAAEGLPSRPPTFCPGCPHRASINILRTALRGIPHVVSSDIGCYSMAPLEPLVWGDSVLAMGASAGVACGLARVLEEKVVAIIGDSTFFHAGMPAVANAAYHGIDFVLVLLDNGVTAMTGQQLHPGTPEEQQPPGSRRIAPEEVLRALGAGSVTIVDPYDRKSALPLVRQVLAGSGFRAIVFRRGCALHSDRNKRRRGERIPVSEVSREACRSFLTCIRDFACPAISLDAEGKAAISPDLCDGCLECAALCPNSAIAHRKEASE